MPHPLEAIDWRLERADDHLATLDSERKGFLDRLDQEDSRVVGHFERDTSEYVFRVAVEPPDGSLGIIVSEFGHHLRAALDNLVWQLVLLRGGSPTSSNQYPIYESRERYLSSRWMLHGVSADDGALIESRQPFQYGERASQAWLTLLAWLNNVDKHRFVHVGCAMPTRFPITTTIGEGQFAGYFPAHVLPVKDVLKIRDVRYVPTITSDDRTELVRVLIEPSGDDPQMEMQRDVPIEISLSDPHQALTLDHLRSIKNDVAFIIERFRPRFDI